MNLANISVQITQDGSSTLFLTEQKEHYHSIHGAVQEAICVYIQGALQVGMNAVLSSASFAPVRVFEMGFGTALNALLTWIEAEKQQIPVQYTAVEAYPLSKEIWEQLNYGTLFPPPYELFFQKLQNAMWQKEEEIGANFDGVSLSPFFSLKKIDGKLQKLKMPCQNYDVVYYDAFSPEIQPELWTTEIFEKVYDSMSENSVLSTYCAKGQVKRNLKELGFIVENLPGPKGKREITRAWKRKEKQGKEIVGLLKK
ncbi:MAG: tRNA (5-methylaminomethyl-2-thiouridine)(34)-methyltransferase MnmD [Bacteroidales bacterium]